MEEFEITAEKIAAGGNCVGKKDGKTVFIPFALPGERLLVRTTKQTRDWDCAQIAKIIEKNPHRIEPVCPLYGKCGGCNLQHADFSYQIELRKFLLEEAFMRNGVNPGGIDVVSGNPLGYRARIRLSGGGFKERESERIVKIPHCPVATKEINDWILENQPKSNFRLFGGEQVKGKIVAIEEFAQNSREKQNIGAKNKKIKQRKNPHFSGTANDEMRKNSKCTAEICGKSISFDARGFFQSNLGVLEKAIEKITKDFFGENALDFYAGCGTFSAFLGDRFGKVTLVEHNRDALVYAEENLRGINHASFGLSGSSFAKIAPNEFFDALVIDPPRTGIEKDVMKWICEKKIPRIKSISCDAATHARDAAILVQNGYALKILTLLDFYPQTAHTESFAEFELL